MFLTRNMLLCAEGDDGIERGSRNAFPWDTGDSELTVSGAPVFYRFRLVGSRPPVRCDRGRHSLEYATRVLICAGKLVICHHHDLQPPTHLTKVEPECRAGIEYAATLRHAKDTLLLHSPV